MIDLASLANPAKEKDYGDESALQYGVSVGAEEAGTGAGAAHQFFSADTRVVFGVNALEIGLVELFDMGLKRYMHTMQTCSISYMGVLFACVCVCVCVLCAYLLPSITSHLLLRQSTPFGVRSTHINVGRCRPGPETVRAPR